MDYKMMVAVIRKYAKKKHLFYILNDIKTRPDVFISDRKEITEKVLTALTEDVLELLLEKMHEDGYIIKDDGRTVTFSIPFIFEK